MVFLGIDWGKIVSVPFWLDVNPGELSDYFEKLFFVVLVVCYGAFGLLYLAEKRLLAQRNFIMVKFLRKLGSFFITMAVSFTFIFFFRYEAIPVLGGRFWVLVWLISGIIWLGFIVRYYFVEVPVQQKSLEQKQRLKKYLVK
ncbi:MAG: hypothetical protein NTZ49_05440 [Candidatus Parcubacteria bacterium]|nr:hypothetical protein [Candidatus Parcubacteria bacterium]